MRSLRHKQARPDLVEYLLSCSRGRGLTRGCHVQRFLTWSFRLRPRMYPVDSSNMIKVEMFIAIKQLSSQTLDLRTPKTTLLSNRVGQAAFNRHLLLLLSNVNIVQFLSCSHFSAQSSTVDLKKDWRATRGMSTATPEPVQVLQVPHSTSKYLQVFPFARYSIKNFIA